MANISNCWGKLYFEKEFQDKEKVVKFVNELNEITSGDSWGDYRLEFMTDDIYEDDDNFFVEFIGGGRWSFNSHLAWVFGLDNFGYRIDEKIKTLYKKPEYNGIEFTLEYCDYDTGCDFMTLEARMRFKIDNQVGKGIQLIEDLGELYNGGIDIEMYADYRDITLEEAFVEFYGEPEDNEQFEFFAKTTGREYQPEDMEDKHRYYYRGYLIEGRRFWINPTVWSIDEKGEFVDYKYDDDNNGQYDYTLDRYVITHEHDNKIYIEVSTDDYTFEEIKEHIRLGDIKDQLQCEQYYNC